MSAFSFEGDSVSAGLTTAQVEQSRREHGDNVLTPPPSVSLWQLYMDKYRDPIIQVLLFAAAVSLVLAFFKNDFVETVGIILAIFFATTVGFYFERDATRRFSMLTALDEEQPVKVRREGKVVLVSRRDIVVGDVILLETGDEVPADARLIHALNLQVDESTLTGEPMAEKVVESGELRDESGELRDESGEMRVESGELRVESGELRDESDSTTYPSWQLLRSSLVMSGRAEAVVTAVGDQTEIGKVARQSLEFSHVKTPLSLQLDRLASLISKVGSAISIAAFLVFLIHDILVNTTLWHSTDYVGMSEVVLKYFMMAVTLIVMAVPEGLPMAITLALALNMRRMLKSNNLVRRLHASETMGAVTVICTDKTGTLTQNRMEVREVLTECGKRNFWSSESHENLFSNGRVMTKVSEANVEDNQLVFLAMAVNSTAELNGDQGIGNPTEVALLRYLQRQGIDYRALRRETEVLSQDPFSTERKYMTTTIRVNGSCYTLLKGAPEVVMARCTMIDKERDAVEQTLFSAQQRAMRTLALAVASQEQMKGAGDEDREHGFLLQAIVTISDPVRSDVPNAVAECRKAGIDVKIVTGDNGLTAWEVARQIGLLPTASVPFSQEEGSGPEVSPQGRSILSGQEFEALSDEEAMAMLKELKVLSRARPSDKQRLVELLQRMGEVVAVTGDGTNDAPALNRAHVGLSLGSGTNVAKDASDMTLLDDSFRSVSRAVMWGRSLYKNLQRFLYFQLVVNVTALLLVLVGAFVGTEMPLTVTQILWVNLIMDTFAALALASLVPSRDVMNDPPRSRSAFIIPRSMGIQILLTGFLFFGVMFVFLLYCEFHRADGIDIRELTWFFTTFVMLQFWNLLNAKALGSRHPALRHFFWNRGMVLVLGLILLGQFLIVQYGGRMFRTVPLSWQEWGVIIAATSLVLWIPESVRMLRSKQ